MSKYDDIINLPHYEPHHPRMSLGARAAQFAPFSALTGYDGAIAETARLTDRMIELTEEEQAELSRKITRAYEKRLPVSITCFQPDPLKEGGSYVRLSGIIRKIDLTARLLTLTDGSTLPLPLIIAVTLPGCGGLKSI